MRKHRLWALGLAWELHDSQMVMKADIKVHVTLQDSNKEPLCLSGRQQN